MDYYIEYICIPETQRLFNTIEHHVLPPFDHLESRAEKMAQDEWDRVMSQPAGDYEVDPGDLAAQVQDQSLGWYEVMSDMGTAVKNLCAVWLFHLFEQHMKKIIRTYFEVTTSPRESVMSGAVTARIAENLQIDVTGSPQWTPLIHLQWLANAVKHGDGPSGEKLRDARPELFQHPFERETGKEDRLLRAGIEISPLAGEGIFVSKQDLRHFHDAIVQHWKWLLSEIARESSI